MMRQKGNEGLPHDQEISKNIRNATVRTGKEEL